MIEKDKLQLEYVISELGDIVKSVLNADYCKKCWKFNICRLFKPCKALLDIEEDIYRIFNRYQEDSEGYYEDLIDILCKKEEKNRRA